MWSLFMWAQITKRNDSFGEEHTQVTACLAPITYQDVLSQDLVKSRSREIQV